MPSFLLFTLWAPLGAMGEVAVGERRVGLDRPGRSAVLGLVAAALGIERGEEEALLALDVGYGVAQRIDATGTLLQDYHTAQVPPARRGRRWATRRDELSEATLETILSMREYRAEPRITAALWARDGAPRPLGELQQALLRPRFHLYLGRKACPLGLPPAPRLVEDVASLTEAFARFDAGMSAAENELRQRLGLQPVNGRIHADLDAEPWLGSSMRIDRIERRRDRVVSRKRWQFGLRDELVIEMAGSA